MTASEERRLKVLLKNAVTEVLEKRQNLLRAALFGSLEYMAILKAIRYWEESLLVSPSKIFQRLARAA